VGLQKEGEEGEEGHEDERRSEGEGAGIVGLVFAEAAVERGVDALVSDQLARAVEGETSVEGDGSLDLSDVLDVNEERSLASDGVVFCIVLGAHKDVLAERNVAETAHV
jgi:hypothetical protein